MYIDLLFVGYHFRNLNCCEISGTGLKQVWRDICIYWSNKESFTFISPMGIALYVKVKCKYSISFKKMYTYGISLSSAKKESVKLISMYVARAVNFLRIA